MFLFVRLTLLSGNEPLNCLDKILFVLIYEEIKAKILICPNTRQYNSKHVIYCLLLNHLSHPENLPLSS